MMERIFGNIVNKLFLVQLRNKNEIENQLNIIVIFLCN